MDIFKYGETELNYLKEKDPILAKTINGIGFIKREVINDIFEGIVNSIISQQISLKSAITVSSNLQNKVGEITPKSIFNTPIEDIQKCGMSMRKATYIKGVSSAVVQGDIDLNNFKNLQDDEIIKILTSLNGIGIWTAEMILIFCMQRKDVLSFGDLAIRKGIMKLYGLNQLTKEDFEKYKKRYSPYGSIASLYLWEISH